MCVSVCGITIKNVNMLCFFLGSHWLNAELFGQRSGFCNLRTFCAVQADALSDFVCSTDHPTMTDVMDGVDAAAAAASLMLAAEMWQSRERAFL